MRAISARAREAKLEVDRIWVGAAENDRREGGLRHVGLGDEHTDEVLQVGTLKSITVFSWLKRTKPHRFF